MWCLENSKYKHAIQFFIKYSPITKRSYENRFSHPKVKHESKFFKCLRFKKNLQKDNENSNIKKLYFKTNHKYTALENRLKIHINMKSWGKKSR